jgi:TatD DNase family protein
MFDAHRHLPTSQTATANALYATSSIDEWGAPVGPDSALSLGALASSPLPDPALLYDRLSANQYLQIGEVGLDRRYADLDGQKEFLRSVLTIGWELGRGVSLHCVRADGYLIEILRERKTQLPVLLWHGCTASREIRSEASSLGVIISYGPNLYRSKIAAEAAGLIEGEWALESDWEGDEEQYHSTLYEHAATFARLTGLSVESVVRNNDEKRAILTHLPSSG